jgi:hypothetical protein
LDRIGIQDARGTYGLVGNDVAADGETHAGAVPERGASRARRSAAAQDASPNRGQPTSHLALSLSDLSVCVWWSWSNFFILALLKNNFIDTPR